MEDILIMAAKTAKREEAGARAGSTGSNRAFDEAIRDLVQVSRLLGDETRLRILFYLVQNEELHVTDLCDRLGQSQPAVSHHLALLRVSGLIEARREGKHNFYSVRQEAFGDLLMTLFSASGEVPRKVKFQDFTLTYQGR
jgi:ArsR family transcriptional regulator, arsenate/arsenite/antimonite-responsive transcriptional repressor